MNRLQYHRRLLEPHVERLLKSFPVCVLTGARQTGKSTLVQKFPGASKRAYFSLDELDVLEQARTHPDSLLRHPAPITIDEVQRSPDLLLAVKRVVDKNRVPGQFLLTGSANLLLMQRVSETLAGRAVYLSLWPMTHQETRGFPSAGMWSQFFELASSDWSNSINEMKGESLDWRETVRRGGYPTPALSLDDASSRADWFAGYVRSYLERDVQDVASISSLVDFRRLMRATCLRLGAMVNQTEIARDVGMSQPTVHRYLNALEASYQLVRIPAYAVNKTKRLIKTPKVYWVDTGLAMHIAGEHEPRGAHLENLILNDLLTWRSGLRDEPQVLYWRASTGQEIDFVIEWNGKLLPIEVKSTAKPRTEDARNISLFRSEYGKQALRGLLVHTGVQTRWLSDDALAVPWWKVI
ncbi:MAG: ATP-binding protein [Ignavibacteriae bacterium]|nr:ATP-binding protein [Ignavibacteriota bacterium]